MSDTSERFINLPIEKNLLNQMGEYTNSLRSKLNSDTEVDLNHTILGLRNQVLQYFLFRAEIINNDLILSLNSLKCKHSLLKEKYKVKSHTSKAQNERILLLEQTVDYLHNSYTKIIKHFRRLEQESPLTEVNMNRFVKPITRRGMNTVVSSMTEIELKKGFDIHDNLKT